MCCGEAIYCLQNCQSNRLSFPGLIGLLGDSPGATSVTVSLSNHGIMSKYDVHKGPDV
jgi:hypothetical protein